MNPLTKYRSTYLDASVRIGERIVKEAIWHEDRCNWVGAEPMERSASQVRPSLTSKTLGPDLYSGTSGVALFLAELFAVTRESDFRRTALGAIRQAISRIDSVPSHPRLGLFNGWTGIALALVRMAMILDDPGLLETGRGILSRVLAEDFHRDESDIISGRAGAIAALVVLHAVLDDSFLINSAVRLGHELIDVADKSTWGCSWTSTGVQNHHNLTGFSHGTSGAASSMLELYAATGMTCFMDAALGAFRYERHWFNVAEGNWPDFRKNSLSQSRRSTTFPCLSFWCHGAPGIALSRVRAYEILRDEVCMDEAIVALKTTRNSLVAANDASAGNYSLCHGIAGNAEALFYAAQVFEGEFMAELNVVHEAAVSGIERFLPKGKAWPCGTHVGETYGLMLGLSGIGHHFLRLYSSSTPGIVILRKEEWLRHMRAIKTERSLIQSARALENTCAISID